jgi:hypothetical protein
VLGVWTVRISENRGENLGCTVEFPVAWGGVDDFEGGQPTQENLVPIQVVGKPRDAMMGWVAINKGGPRQYWGGSIFGGNKEGKSVLEKAI